MESVLKDVMGDESVAVDVQKKHISVTTIIIRILMYIAGACGVVGSWLLFMTIKGIVVAIPLFFLSIKILDLARVKYKLACPHCDTERAVKSNAEHYLCKQCRKITFVNWIK
ncbi:hypothetical protein [Priestia taiwanensis]|uniref:Uncharacterized protein n=1 Tax=Priestia taiwanensis TaxID=1347902 RepID=A0A917AK91_9BACI|nr:hypothetical protein [Priestia taiwanensis]MBM7362012.1 hypothetical protein [Priestia taiwanensis]GGE58732.1 hypothetical protein GCM10007140_06370 [Priestia taiwanensis]